MKFKQWLAREESGYHTGGAMASTKQGYDQNLEEPEGLAYRKPVIPKKQTWMSKQLEKLFGKKDEAIENIGKVIGHLGPMTLGQVAEVKTNFPDADFWLVRKGTEEAVGKPSKEFKEEDIGIKVTNTDVVLPDFLFYAMMHLHNQGVWRHLSKGTLRLKHISTRDVKNIPLQS
jgi:hypothetical protein